MENNDILIRLRYALDIKNKEMAHIFKLGDMNVTVPEVVQILTKVDDEAEGEDTHQKKCNNQMLNAFLNGLITFKRGEQKPRQGQAERPKQPVEKSPNANNLLLKKVKIALTLTTEDVLAIINHSGVIISKGELGALLRKKGHQKYKACGDKFARNFLKGLAMKYRS